jgi:rod shape-determining protein MreC
VAYRDSPFQELKVPLTWTAGAATVLALAAAVMLFVSDRKDQAKVNAQALGHAQVRAGFDSAAAPVSGVLAAPMRWITDGAGSVGDYFFAVSENKKLKKRIVELQQLEATDIALRNLNRRYEELLKLRTEPPIPMVTGRVVSDTRGPFANARLIDVGANGGVKIGNPAMSEHGVVGRVVGVSGNASRLLLLTDPESRTPVLIDRSNARAVLTGDGGSNPRLDYIRGGKDVVKNGDLVLTSGDGGLYPRGLPVGVAQQDIRGVWRIRLYSDNANIDFVRVLVYDDFSQMVDQAKLAAPSMPPLSAAAAAQVKAAETKPPAAPPAATVAPGAVTGAPVVTPSPAAKTPPPAIIKAPPPAKPTLVKPVPISPTPVVTKPVKAAASAVKPGSAKAVAGKPGPKKPAKLPPGVYKRVHTPSDVFPQYDPRYPNGNR